MQKRIILFDIDRTIFDTDKMIGDIGEATLKILGYPDMNAYDEVLDKYIKTLKNERRFVPEDYIKLICTRFNFKDEQKLLDVFYGKEYEYIYRNNVFPETLKIVAILKDKFKFGIFSEGTKKFQNNKFESTGLRKYMDKDLIFIVDAKDIGEILNKIPRSAIIVDDKEYICEFLTKNGIEAIWLNKKDDRINNNFQTIHNLLELPRILV